MSIYLIRHGKTGGNAERRLQVPETPLNDEGLDQAQRLAERLGDVGLVRIVASDYARAFKTAQIVADGVALSVEVEPLFRERHFGDHRGMLYSEIGEDLFGPTYSPPGGEDQEAFQRRGARAWQKLCAISEETAGPLAIVTHGMLYGYFLSQCVELPDPAQPVPMLGNTAVTIIERSAPYKVSLLACTAHL